MVDDPETSPGTACFDGIGPRARIPFGSSMSTSSTAPSRVSTAVPALAAVLVSAMLLSVAVATGTAPRLAPGVAVHAMLFGTTGAQGHDVAAVAPATPARQASRPTIVRGRGLTSARHDAFLASAPSTPGRGDLPPPAAV